MEKTSKISWKDIIQWEVISILVNEAFDGDLEIDEEIKQESLQKFEELHSEEEINEMDFDDIEDEMIDILIDILDDGTNKGKEKEVLIEIKKNSKLTDLNYLAKMMEQNPNLKRVFQKRKKKNTDDDEDDNKFGMYI